MSTFEELSATLFQALIDYRTALTTKEEERTNELPHKGKQPSNDEDDVLQQEHQIHLVAVNRFLQNVDVMVAAVIGPNEKESDKKAPDPAETDVTYEEDEPIFVAGRLIEPITPFSPGPSTREGPLEDRPLVSAAFVNDNDFSLETRSNAGDFTSLTDYGTGLYPISKNKKPSTAEKFSDIPTPFLPPTTTPISRLIRRFIPSGDKSPKEINSANHRENISHSSSDKTRDAQISSVPTTSVSYILPGRSPQLGQLNSSTPRSYSNAVSANLSSNTHPQGNARGIVNDDTLSNGEVFKKPSTVKKRSSKKFQQRSSTTDSDGNSQSFNDFSPNHNQFPPLPPLSTRRPSGSPYASEPLVASTAQDPMTTEPFHDDFMMAQQFQEEEKRLELDFLFADQLRLEEEELAKKHKLRKDSIKKGRGGIGPGSMHPDPHNRQSSSNRSASHPEWPQHYQQHRQQNRTPPRNNKEHYQANSAISTGGNFQGRQGSQQMPDQLEQDQQYQQYQQYPPYQQNWQQNRIPPKKNKESHRANPGSSTGGNFQGRRGSQQMPDQLEQDRVYAEMLQASHQTFYKNPAKQRVAGNTKNTFGILAELGEMESQNGRNMEPATEWPQDPQFNVRPKQKESAWNEQVRILKEIENKRQKESFHGKFGIKEDEEREVNAEARRRAAEMDDARVKKEKKEVEDRIKRELMERAAMGRKEAEDRRKTEKAEEEARRIKQSQPTCKICQICFEKGEVVHLPCEHAFCHTCIKQSLEKSLEERTPFICCSRALSIHSVPKLPNLFALKFIKSYDELMLEFSTSNPLYCAAPGCFKFIAPRSIHGDIGICQKCSARTCRHCLQLEHSGICPKDKEAARVKDLAKRK
ncbi:hypothetical protein RUND412_008897 [Rhizina undulata]